MRPIQSIQVLRGVAACLVAACHAAMFTDSAARASTDPAAFHLGDWLNLSAGRFGVDLFFVISGFIMMVATEPEAKRHAGAFLARRALRIFPLWWVCSAAALILLPIPFASLTQADWISVIRSLTLFPEFDAEGKIRPILLGQGWTLIYELYFYAVFAIFVGCGRSKKAVGAGLCLIGFFAAASLAPNRTPIIVVVSDPLILEFLAGVVIGFVYLKGFRVASSIATGLGFAGLAVLVALLGYDFGLNHTALSILAALTSVFAVLLATCSIHAEKLASRNWMLRLGNASYSIYLTHTLVLTLVSQLWKGQIAVRSLPADLLFLLAFVASVFVGVASYFAVERPIERWLKRRGKPLPLGFAPTTATKNPEPTT